MVSEVNQSGFFDRQLSGPWMTQEVVNLCFLLKTLVIALKFMMS